MAVHEIKPNIFSVGAIDWNIRDFHGYQVNRGTTYNAYLIKDEKITLVDTVKNGFQSDLIHNIHKVVDPKKIDYLVVNHVEPDHSGSLPEIVDLVEPETIYCSTMGKKVILEHFHRDNWPLHPVKDGDQISLGEKTVTFIETRMLHWPDSMFSYVQEDNLLISSDGFGQHWATSQRFDDEVDFHELMFQAKKYFANILLLYSPLVQKVLKKAQDAGLAIDMIAPDHGLVWRSHVDKIIEAYDRWSRQELKPKAVIAYETMWHSTEKMAKAITEGLIQEGIEVKVMRLKDNHRSDVVTESLDAAALLFGSSTLNNQMLPSMADILTYMKGLKPSDRLGVAFGSFGWSGEAVKHITQYLEEMKLEIVGDGLRIKNVPAHEQLSRCVELGREVAKAIKAKLG